MERERRWLVMGMSALLEAAARGAQLTAAAAHLVEGFALGALSDDELTGLTSARYARSRPSRDELHAWEGPWLERDLPAAPARILVGGAGRGREVRWLGARGYEVVAFDPAHRPGQGVLQLSYQDLSASGAGPRAAALATVRAAAPFDAVLLGWGSFTHVPGEQPRLDVLRAVRRLSDGPVLLSYWRTEAGARRAWGRVRRTGERLGRVLGGATAARRSDRVVPHAGYAHVFTDDELDALAAAAGYRCERWLHGYPHATLRPCEP